MDSKKWQRTTIRFGLILTLILSIGLLGACGNEGGNTQKPLVDAGAPTEPELIEEKNWNKMNWDSGKWG